MCEFSQLTYTYDDTPHGLTTPLRPHFILLYKSPLEYRRIVTKVHTLLNINHLIPLSSLFFLPSQVPLTRLGLLNTVVSPRRY